MKPIPWLDLFDALNDFRRTWPQLLLTDLLSRIIVVAALAPIIGLLIKIFLLQTNDGVLTDTDIVMFLFHPLGLAAFVIVCAVSLGVLLAEQGVLLVIGFGAAEDRRVTWLDAMRYVSRHTIGLVRLAGQAVVRLSLLSAPFLAAVGGVCLLLINKHDINFYLLYKPPEFWLAVSFSGIILFIMALVVLKKCAGWMIAMPLLLFEGIPPRQAMQESAYKTAEFGWKIAILLAGWLAGVAFLSSLLTFLIGLAGNALLPDMGRNFAPLILVSGMVLTVTTLGNVGIVIISTMLFPLFIVRLYRASAGAGQLAPRLSARGSLGRRASFQIPGKAVIGFSAAALLLIIAAAYAVSLNMEQKDTVEIIAHRGASGAAPENTMAAFERAIVEKADWIELDVQENADDVVVVAHDSDLMKVARNSLTINDATSEDLQNIDIGSWFAPEFSNQRMPTLKQALNLAKGKLGVVIELKYYGHDRELESRVVEIVEQTGMESDIMIMSLKINGLHKLAALRPSWPRGLLNTASVGDLTRLNLDFLALNSMAASFSMISRTHRRGLKVYVWTINDPVQMSVMISRGIDGIITDKPALARQVIELREQLTPFGRLIVWIAGEIGLLPGVDIHSTEEDA